MPQEIVPVEDEMTALLKKVFSDVTHNAGFVRVDGVLVPKCFEQYADKIENFEVRDDDVWICNFPKTGTTWTQEMIWCIANDLDFDAAKVPLTTRFPFFEICAVTDYAEFQKHNPEIHLLDHAKNSISFVENLPSPRFIKSHLPFNLLPRQLRSGEKKPKIISTVRNAKDTCISYYHHSKLFENIEGNFDEFCTLFLNDAVIYGPFWKHVLSYWNKRTEENHLFLKYEDMKKDLPVVIQKTAEFLGKSLTTDQISVLTKHLSFSSMKLNPATNNEDLVDDASVNLRNDVRGRFMRCGKVDQWKSDMSPKFIKLFDEWSYENMKNTGLRF